MDVFNTFLRKVEDNIITPIVELLALAAFIVFVWGVIQYIRDAADDTKRATGRRHMIWGIIGLAIMFSANIFVSIIQNTVNSI